MMIQKIESITNVGNYEDYIASGDVAFKKMNFIYAENGAGKTTLARILQSLGSGDSSIIRQRYRIGAINPSTISIKGTDNTMYIYNRDKWNNILPVIDVFDANFVSENVYTGFEINNDHKKHLYKFVLGDSGVKIARKIERVKILIDKKNLDISSLRSLIQAETKCEDVDAFCKLKSVDDVDTIIEKKNRELEIARNNETIKRQIELPLLPCFPDSIDYDKIIEVLSISIDGIAKDYLDLVNEHINKLEKYGMQHGSQWVYMGYQATLNSADKLCPFCGNSIENASLIKGYNQFFSDAYKKTIQELKSIINIVESINIDLYISNITSLYKQFEAQCDFWSNYVQPEIQRPNLEYSFPELSKSFNLLKNSLCAKQNNPIDKVSIVEIESFKKGVDRLTSVIEEINNYSKAFNEKIHEIKTQLHSTAEVTKELNELILYKKRYQTPIKEYCNQYSLLVKHLKKLQKINKEYQILQKEESSAIFEMYGSKTNYYLRNVFGTKFQIAEIKDGGIKGRSKEANLDYSLTFNGTVIQQDGELNTSFKNVLSEGDKNTIAFSFFLAKIITDPNIGNKIIVFDDPLTSLDLNRRNATIFQLALLQEQCSQIVVLSHNLHFLIELHSISKIKKANKKVLQIVNNSGKSIIKEYTIKKDWIDNYQKSLDTMEVFLSDSSLDEKKEEAINAIRLSLETFLKLKYCKYISDQNQTFGQLIGELEKSVCTFINPNKGEVIDKLNQLLYVSWRTHHATIEEKEIYTEVTISNAEAVQYVNMTIDLLYKEL